MKAHCLDIGTIQAFLDGETEPTVSLKVADHISSCDACSAMLAEAEEESAMVFPLLEREFNTLVPTQRLWSKINDEIAVQKQNQPFWRKMWSAVAVQLSNPSIAVAASFVIILGLFAAFWNGEMPQQNADLAYSPAVSQETAKTSPITIAENDTPKSAAPPRVGQADVIESPENRTQEFVAVKAVARSERPVYTNAVRINPAPASSADSSGYIPGEDSYVKTISTLAKAIDGQKDEVMAPSERVSFERDMAVVDDSIKRVRQEVRKNPRNESARQVLYASYQNKIDLLNSVTQKEELMVALR